MSRLTSDYVHGLLLPELLVSLINENKWKHPGEEIIKSVIPFFREPIVFLNNIEEMERESQGHEGMDVYFDGYSDKDSRANFLPWRDIKTSFFIAVCKYPGDDIGIALDYRTSIENPRVIGNNWYSKSKGCPWQEISPTFDEFVKQIGLV